MVAAVKLHRHVGRRRAGRFLAEGPNLVEAALRRGLVVDVFVTEDAASRRFGDLLAGAPVHLVTERAAKALSDTVTPGRAGRGVRAAATPAWPTCSARSPRLVASRVEISEPGNAGTLIRIADAMGADAVVLAGHSVDPYNGKCLRASAGSIFALPVVVGARRRRRVAALRERGPAGAGHHGGRRDVASTTPIWLGADRVAVRRRGARPARRGGGAGRPRVRIPMPGSAESLNVAAAAAICLYQSARTRHSNA